MQFSESETLNKKYWSEKNSVGFFEATFSTVNSRDKYILICPNCGIEFEKRVTSILKTGAFCESCAKRRCPRTPLRWCSTRLSEMLDKAENVSEGGFRITSDYVNASSSEELNFYCEGSPKVGRRNPHIFKKAVCVMWAAEKKGTWGCPVCAGFELRPGVNDFGTLNPELAPYFDEEKNGKKVSEVHYIDRQQYWWKCPKGHSFQRDPDHMMRSQESKTFGCPVCYGRRVQAGVNDLQTLRPDVMKYWNYEENTLKPTEVSEHSNKLACFWCAKCGEPFYMSICVRGYTNGLCENCRKHTYSKDEKKLLEFVHSWGIECEENQVFDINGKKYSLDIYVPSKEIGIEYNGLYRHSDAVREPNYHYNKYKAMKSIGIRVINIWEDDFLYKSLAVEKLLMRVLGIANERKVNARECTCCELSNLNEVRDFCVVNHIQGFVSGGKYLGLRDNLGNLVACMIVQEKSKKDSSLEIKRYCTSCNVRGGFTKLLSYVKDLGYPYVYTFSDNAISEGKLYENSGFTVCGYLLPDYSYVSDGLRQHKFNYRKDRFYRDESLQYVEGLSESELAAINDLPRVYDAGKVKWEKLL